MRTKLEIDRMLEEQAKKTGAVVAKVKEYNRAAGVNEPSESPRPITVIPTAVSPIAERKR